MELWCSDCMGSNRRCSEPSSSTSRSPLIDLPRTSRKIRTHPTIKFGFMSCMCISMRQCPWLILDDVDDLSYLSKYVWMFIDNVDDFYSQIWCLLVDSRIWCMYVLCGFSSVDDIVYVVVNIPYVSIWIFCVATHGVKHIRRHFWPLVGLTSVGTYHSWWKLRCPNFCRLWYVPTEVSGLTSVSRQGPTEVTPWGGGGGGRW
jgi:hypothetical protein